MINRVDAEVGKDGAKLTWVFPGGWPEEGETLEKAMVREVLKETGFLVAVDQEISSRVHPQFPEVEVHYFAAKVFSQNQLRPIEEKDEVAEYRWIKPTEIKTIITSNLDPKVSSYLGI